MNIYSFSIFFSFLIGTKYPLSKENEIQIIYPQNSKYDDKHWKVQLPMHCNHDNQDEQANLNSKVCNNCSKQYCSVLKVHICYHMP